MRKINYTTYRKARQLLKQGENANAVAKKIGISQPTAQRIAKSKGWADYQKTYYQKPRKKAQRKKSFWERLKSFFAK